MLRAVRIRWLLAALLAAGLFVVANQRLSGQPKLADPRELDVVLPRFAQLALTTGDGYLAANLATIRAVTANINVLTPDQWTLLGRIQVDAAWFNPANEDNYYVAANTLPWHGEFDAAQTVLERAMQARPFDWMPSFYYAFDLWYFRREAARAAAILRQAIGRTHDVGNQIALDVLATKWSEQGYDTATALALMRAQAANAPHGNLRAFYAVRARRLEGLLQLEQAAASFRARVGRPPAQLYELVVAGDIEALPVDPWGFGYALAKDGTPVLRNRRKPAKGNGQ